MNYFDAVRFLENLQRGKIRTNFKKIKEALEELDNPHKKFSSIHIAGTNGKGSTAVMVHSILTEAGYKSGIYTSPHILDFTERIKVSCKPIPKRTVTGYVEKLNLLFKKYKCTYFEAVTIISFVYFYEQSVDIAVVETGMGGTWDATSLVNPIITVITDIGLEHTRYLGNTVKEIAAEKGGIIKTSTDCIVGASNTEAVNTLKKIAKSKKTDFYAVSRYAVAKPVKMCINGTSFNYRQKNFSLQNLYIPLTGLHQVKNARTAVFTVNKLREKGFSLNNKHIISGLKNLDISGRFEIINRYPYVICDVGHNPDAFKTIKITIKKLFPSKMIFLLFGAKSDKDYLSMVRIIKPVCKKIIGVSLKEKQSFEPETLIPLFKKTKVQYSVFDSCDDGLKFFLKNAVKDDIIVTAGSHLIVEETKKYFRRL
ncbi:bifunctional folylpolyglutamate synthase/dihydrofolate synthase [candidate division KSB1 bacterium]